MATCTVTIADQADGGVSIEIAHDAPQPGRETMAQRIAVALRDQLRDVSVGASDASLTDVD